MGETDNKKEGMVGANISNNEKKPKKKKSSGSKKRRLNKLNEKYSVTFYYILVAGFFALIIGIIWAIFDAIQPVGKWDWFVNQNVGIKFAILGSLGIFLFSLAILVFAFFKKGNRLIYRLLFPSEIKEKITKDNRYAQVIAIGLIVSVFVLAFGLIISLVQGVFTHDPNVNFIDYLLSLPNGLKIILISGLFEIFVILIIIFVYLWQNGYSLIVNKVLTYNKIDEKLNFTRNQNIVGLIFYLIMIISSIVAVFGIIWSIGDAIMPTGKWDAFLTYPFGWKFSIVGGLASLLFYLLLLGFLFLQKGRTTLKKMLFVKRVIDKEIPKNKVAQVLTIGILAGIIAIIVGMVISLVMYLISMSQGSTSIFEFLASLPNGLLILLLSSGVIGGLWLIIGMVYLW
ncbi:MAG: hypothetical protein ACTSVC_16555, partial [Promethearchaeota archaeon]